MDEKDFCYWLQGFFELSGIKEISFGQASIIKDHLDLVFSKVTPDRNVIGFTDKDVFRSSAPISHIVSCSLDRF